MLRRYIYIVNVICRDSKELKVQQAKSSVDSVRALMNDKNIKNKAERER
jgi:hypothetical protein